MKEHACLRNCAVSEIFLAADVLPSSAAASPVVFLASSAT
jgi:hypothetical protein